jgi:quercetin dioxygenase-like cupin family protein
VLLLGEASSSTLPRMATENDVPEKRARRTKARPVVARESERDCETWAAEDVAKRGRVSWKTLFSRDKTPTEALTLGIARIPPGEALGEHRHAEPEIYLVLEGIATVTIAGDERRVEAGAAIFIPGNAVHGCRNEETRELRFAYVFPTDSFNTVEYVFVDLADS